MNKKLFLVGALSLAMTGLFANSAFAQQQQTPPQQQQQQQTGTPLTPAEVKKLVTANPSIAQLSKAVAALAHVKTLTPEQKDSLNACFYADENYTNCGVAINAITAAALVPLSDTKIAD